MIRGLNLSHNLLKIKSIKVKNLIKRPVSTETSVSSNSSLKTFESFKFKKTVYHDDGMGDNERPLNENELARIENVGEFNTHFYFFTQILVQESNPN